MTEVSQNLPGKPRNKGEVPVKDNFVVAAGPTAPPLSAEICAAAKKAEQDSHLKQDAPFKGMH